MRALQLAGEELQADVAHFQFLSEHGEFAAAEPLVLMDDKGDGDAGGADLPGELHGGLQLLVARVEIFSEKTPVTPASARESSCASRDCRAVEARA